MKPAVLLVVAALGLPACQDAVEPPLPAAATDSAASETPTSGTAANGRDGTTVARPARAASTPAGAPDPAVGAEPAELPPLPDPATLGHLTGRVAAWNERLFSDDPAVAAEAQRELGELPLSEARAILALTLDSWLSEEPAPGASEAVDLVFGLVVRVVPELLRLARDGDPARRAAAYELLTHADNRDDALPHAGALRDVLLAGLVDPDEDVRDSAREAIRGDWGYGGRSTPGWALDPLVGLLASDAPERRYMVLDMLLAADGLTETHVAAITARIDDEDEDVRDLAAEALPRAGYVALPAVESLARSENALHRVVAVEALGAMEVEAEVLARVVVPLLDDDDPEIRAAAMAAISGELALAGQTLPRLLELVTSGEGSDRFGAVYALARYGAAGQDISSALDALVAAAEQDENDDLRDEALGALVHAGPTSDAAVHALLGALADWGYEPAALGALAALDPAFVLSVEPGALETVARTARSDEADVRRHAIDTLRALGGNRAELLGPLLTAAADPEPMVRLAALESLGSLAVPAERTLPALTRALDDERSDVAAAAVESIATLGPAAAPAMDRLLELAAHRPTEAELSYTPDWIGEALPHALVAADPGGTQSRGALHALLRGDVNRVVTKAADALAALPPDPATTDALIEALAADDGYLAAEPLLRTIAHAGAAATDPVLAALDHPAPSVRRELLGTLAHLPIAPGRVAAAYVGALRDPEPRVRWAAAFELGWLDDALEPAARAAGAESALRRALADDAVRVRIEAARSLWVLTGDTRAAVPVLIAALEDGDETRWSASTLADLGPAAAPALPALLAALAADPDSGEIVHALGAIGDDSDRTVAALNAALLAPPPPPQWGCIVEETDDWRPARAAVATLLGNLGNPTARPALEKALRRDGRAVVRDAAREALAALAGHPAEGGGADE